MKVKYSLRAIKGGQDQMRYLRFFAVALLAVVVGIPAAFAQEACQLTVRGSSGSSIGRIDSDGTFRGSSGSSIGRFASGTVRNKSGSSIGRVDANGTIRNGSGSAIGKVEADGTLRGSSGSRIGRIESNGTVRNSSGSSRGRFDGYVPACRYAAAAYLFFFEPLYNH
jgi:5-fold beta-flower protein